MKFTIGGESHEMKMDSWQRSNASPSIELTVERKMTDIEAKALALWNAVRAERAYSYFHTSINRETDMAEALCRAIEQHEAFRQEVSDTLKTFKDGNMHTMHDYLLEQFIIPAPKPDPLVEVLKALPVGRVSLETYSRNVRAALAARGLEIREKGND